MEVMNTFRNILTLAPLIFLFSIGMSKHTAQTISLKNLPSGLSHKNLNENEITGDSLPRTANYWLPAAEVIGLNLGVWAYHRYISQEGWSAISWKSIKDNFKNGFEWDVDGYLINQFWHPYHGSNYFNTARSNGLSFWESAPYAFGGSLMWEYMMETDPPSYNDIVNTPVTGIILGEISFRVSNLIIDESSTGFERFIREAASTLINPMQGFNRLIRGDMWKEGTPKKKDEFRLVVSTGIHNVFFSRNFNNSKTYGTMRADLIYGNIFDVSKHTTPFDYFSLHTEINIAQGDNIVGIFASGVLWDGTIKLFENSKNIIGVYKEVDIHLNTVYKLSATSISGQIINTVPISTKISLQNYMGLSAILMGGTNSLYSSEYGKDYNIGPGASGKLGAKISVDNFIELYVNYKRYWIHTLSGADSEEFVGLLNTGINYSLFGKTVLGLEYLLYERYGEYNNFPDTRDMNSAIRIYIKQVI